MRMEQWCSRCQSRQVMEWERDDRFGHDAESARCPRCGGIWGVRSRRVPSGDRTPPPDIEDAEGSVSPVPPVTQLDPIESERRPAGGR
jgi:hypothetical protein